MMIGDQLDPRIAASFPDAAFKIVRDARQRRANAQRWLDSLAPRVAGWLDASTRSASDAGRNFSFMVG
jgi:hypothetical protein